MRGSFVIAAVVMLAACAQMPSGRGPRPEAPPGDRGPDQPTASATRRWRTDLPPAAADGFRPQRSLAVLLPLSGRYAAAAESVRDGLLSAHFGETRARPALRFYDTAGNPRTAVERYRQAAADGAARVIGPLDRDAVAALLAQPDLPVPVLALNRDERPLAPGHASFSLSPEDEAVAIAERMLQRGLHRAIVIGDGSEIARRSLDAFAAHWAGHGGELRAAATIDPSFSDFSTALGEAYATVGEDFDAFVLALRAPEARLLIPQLAVAGFPPRPLVATSQIVLGSGDVRLDRELDGIEFPDLAWPLQPVPGTPRADGPVRHLDSARGGRARLFAFGLDAYRLAGRIDWLATDPGARLAGATGELRVDAFGNVLRQPAWSVFEGGRPRPVVSGGLLAEPFGDDGRR